MSSLDPVILQEIYNGRRTQFTPPKRLPRVDTGIVLGVVSLSSQYGNIQSSFNIWDAKEFRAGHTWFLSELDSTTFGKSRTMSLRNDETDAAIWTAAYTSLPFQAPDIVAETDLRLLSIAVDNTAGAAYMMFYVRTTGNVQTYQIIRINLLTGAATYLATMPANSVAAMTTAEDINPIAFMRFVDSTRAQLEIVCTGSAVNIWRAVILSTSTGVVAQNKEIKPIALRANEKTGITLAFSANEYIYASYVTKDKKLTASFCSPNVEGPGTNGLAAAVIIHRGSKRAAYLVPQASFLEFPAPFSNNSSALTIHDSSNAFCYRTSSHYQGLQDATRHMNAYDANDLDRWLHQIADDFGLPAGVAMW